MKNNSIKFKKNDTFHATITDMTNTGAGVCHVDGITIFVNNVADGDEIDGIVIKVYNNYLIGKATNIVKRSEYFVEDYCPVSKKCGGCSFRNISYEHELEIKRRIIENAFKKAGIEVQVPKVLNTGIVDGWRNKVQIPVENGSILGYYSNHSHNVVENPSCVLHDERINKVLEFCSEYLKKNPINELRHICVRSSSQGLLVCLVGNNKTKQIINLSNEIFNAFENVLGVIFNKNNKDTNVIYGDTFDTIIGQDYITDTLSDLNYEISMPSFYQVNKDAALIAYSKLLEIANVNENDTVLDMFCGTGTIGLFFAYYGKIKELTGIEIVDSAIKNAIKNAKNNNIPNAKYFCCDTSDFDMSNQKPDVVIVDPPRKGLSEKDIDNLIKMNPKKIAYMSCNPDTLARDAARLKNHYSLGTPYGIDMFPRCGHIESVVLLTKVHN